MRRAVLAVGIALLGVVPFLPALDGEFLRWDDDTNFLTNPHYRGLGWTQLRWMFTSTLQAVYSPLAWMTLGLNYRLGGMDPWGYHLGNVLLHAINAGLVFLIARRLLAATFRDVPTDGRLDLGAAVAALVFGVHPLRVESVVWITERRDVLSACFYLAAVLAYLRAARPDARIAGAWRWASLAAYAGALLSKGTAMTLPLTLLVLDVYPLRRQRLGAGALLLEKAPYAAMAIAAAGGALLAIDRGSRWPAYENYGPIERVAVALYSMWFYLARLVWPGNLSPFYPLPRELPLGQPWLLVAVFAALAVTVGLLLARGRFPGGLAAWTHAAVTIAPVSGLVLAGNHLVADRYSYLSGLGFAVLAGAALTWALGRPRARGRAVAVGAVAAIAVLAIAGWATAAWRYSHVWRSSVTLWQRAVSVAPECFMCRNNLGASLIGKALGWDDPLIDEAEAHLERATGLWTGYPVAFNRALLGLNLGGLHVGRRRPAAAIPLLREALEEDATRAAASQLLARALSALAAERARLGELAEAAALNAEASSILSGADRRR